MTTANNCFLTIFCVNTADSNREIMPGFLSTFKYDFIVYTPLLIIIRTNNIWNQVWIIIRQIFEDFGEWNNMYKGVNGRTFLFFILYGLDRGWMTSLPSAKFVYPWSKFSIFISPNVWNAALHVCVHSIQSTHLGPSDVLQTGLCTKDWEV